MTYEELNWAPFSEGSRVTRALLSTKQPGRFFFVLEQPAVVGGSASYDVLEVGADSDHDVYALTRAQLDIALEFLTPAPYPNDATPPWASFTGPAAR